MFRKTLLAPVAASAVLTASFLGATSASTARAGQAIWGPPTAISAPGRDLRGADVAVDAAGNTTAAWVRGDVVKAARRPAGGRWRPPITIARGAYWGTDRPQVGADARGNVTVIWDTEARVMTARRQVGRGWTRPVTLSSPHLQYAWTGPHSLAVSPGGAAVVSWWTGDNDSGPGRVEAAYRPAHGRWLRGHVLARWVGGTPAVAIDARGNVTTAFIDARGRVRAARRVVGHGWLPSVRISADRPQDDDNVQVAVDARGDATALWGYAALTAASRPRFHRWSAPIALTSSPREGETLAMNDAGTALVVYANAQGELRIRSKPLHGQWRPARPIPSPAGDGVFRYSPQLVLNPDGDVLLSWSESAFGNDSWYASYRPRGSSWGPPQRFPGGYPETALYRNGNAVAVWLGCSTEEMCRVWARRMTAPR